jgi:hypothetical protein
VHYLGQHDHRCLPQPRWVRRDDPQPRGDCGG